METQDVVDGGGGAFEAKGSPAEPKPRTEPILAPAMPKRMKLDLGNGIPLAVGQVKETEERVTMETDQTATGVMVTDTEQNGLELVEDEHVVYDFQFPPAVPSNFAKFNKNPSLPEMLETISLPYIQRSPQLARAEICPRMHRAQLLTNNSRLKALYGFDVAGATFLYAEEALYLLETGKLEVSCDQVVISAERARCLFLRSVNTPESIIASVRTCDVDEYTVFKYFSKLGYRLRRTTGPWARRGYLEEDTEEYEEEDDDNTVELDTTGSDVENERMDMEEPPPSAGTTKTGQAILTFENHDDLTSQLQGNPPKTTRKRRASRTLESVAEEADDESDSSSVLSMKVEVVVEDDSDCELIGVVDNDGKLNVSGVGIIQEEMEDTDEEDTRMEADEPVAGPSSASRFEALLLYTVTEADSDSDLEIVDAKVCSHGLGGVGIEEIAGDSSGELSSKLGIVDLVSDSEVEECEQEETSGEPESSLKCYEPIWSQLVPNATLKMSFPPAYLLPQNIPSYEDRSADYDCSNLGDKSELELESIVDGLRIDTNSSGDGDSELTDLRSPPRAAATNSPQPQPAQPQVTCTSWKDWRQWVMSEARDVFSESLLGSTAPATATLLNSGKVLNKLHLWKKDKERRSTEKLGLRIPFYLFPPHVAGTSKQRLDNDIEPIYRIAIVKNEALIPTLSDVPTRDEDIPILFVIISEESDLSFVTCNSAPLPSLF